MKNRQAWVGVFFLTKQMNYRCDKASFPIWFFMNICRVVGHATNESENTQQYPIQLSS